MHLEISNPMDYHAALYIRLSKEDESEGPSESVNNQQSLLDEFGQKHRLSVYDTYIELRHAYAVAAIRSGDDIKTVQGNLGHATASFTLDVYDHATDQMKRENAERMEEYIKSIKSIKTD